MVSRMRSIGFVKKGIVLMLFSLSAVLVLDRELYKIYSENTHGGAYSLSYKKAPVESLGEISDNRYIAKAFRKIHYGTSGDCEPVINIMYLKTHKCASSTMQNILFRYACTHNRKHQIIPCAEPSQRKEGLKYTKSVKAEQDSIDGREEDLYAKAHNSTIVDDPIIVAVPSEGTYAGSPQKFNANMLQRPNWLFPPSRRADIFGLHTRMDPYELQKVVHPGSLWITILRNPVELYVSAFSYFKLNIAVKASLQDFLQKPLSEMKNAQRLTGRFGPNQMTFDLGYSQDTFYDDSRIDEMIRELEDTFDLVLVAERMDEALVMLGHALCWSVDDLVALRKNVRSQSVSLTPEEEKKLEDLNYSDLRLYQHFSRQFEALTQLYGPNKLTEEVKELRLRREEIENYCVKDVVKGHDAKASIKEYSGSVLGFQLAHPEDPTCKALAWNSRHYVSYFRDLMRSRYDKPAAAGG